MTRALVAIAVLAAAGTVLAGPPRKPWMSWQEAMILWQGQPKQEQQEQKQEQQKPKPQKPHKPCRSGARWCDPGFHEDTNYPPYDYGA